ncbi:hypothetical protein PSTT_14650 [Puccinia striiformis]|uniref:Uncharacterized protein n=1 Tax=Puccinia striiformis TaxID=27350 RepID=A0A2S4ULV4_9BASI|nr:hypothetical protein PSTT_14650 [Puccinia striiformis]
MSGRDLLVFGTSLGIKPDSHLACESTRHSQRMESACPNRRLFLSKDQDLKLDAMGIAFWKDRIVKAFKIHNEGPCRVKGCRISMQEDMIFWNLEMVEDSTKLDHQSRLKRLLFSLAISSNQQEGIENSHSTGWVHLFKDMQCMRKGAMGITPPQDRQR